SMLDAIGIEYARTAECHGNFRMPDNFLRWSPTCHHRDMLAYGKRWLEESVVFPTMSLLYVWGHSFEFNRDNNWELLEEFGQLVHNPSACSVWIALDGQTREIRGGETVNLV